MHLASMSMSFCFSKAYIIALDAPITNKGENRSFLLIYDASQFGEKQ
jgi:hypothetical protein